MDMEQILGQGHQVLSSEDIMLKLECRGGQRKARWLPRKWSNIMLGTRYEGVDWTVMLLFPSILYDKKIGGSE